MSQAVFDQSQLPDFRAIKPDIIEPTIRHLLEKNRQRINQLLTQTAPFTWENLLHPLEDMSDELHKIWSPIAHIHSVMQSEALRKAYNNTLPLLTEYHTEISQNEKLFSATESIAKRPDFFSLNDAERKIIENDIRDFKLAGIHLSANQKIRMAALQQELSQAMTTFSENILDATDAYHLNITNVEQVKGLPEQAIQLAVQKAKERGLPGYVITLDYPVYSTAMKFLQDRNIREKLYTAYATRASDQGPFAGKWDNSKIIEDILRIRHEIAQLVGYKNYADYSLTTKMANTADEVLHFLNDLLIRSKPIAEKEYAEVAALAKQFVWQLKIIKKLIIYWTNIQKYWNLKKCLQIRVAIHNKALLLCKQP